jgi:serine/threonine protein phosphatase PrpC
MAYKSRWRAAGLTDIGRVRQSNQDHFEMLDTHGCWIIADGMGGHAGGGVASRVAVEAIAASVRTLDDESDNQGEAERLQHRRELSVTTAIVAGHTAIRAAATRNASLAGMGTTIVVLRLYASPARPTSPGPIPAVEAVVGHVGDSRAYLFRSGTLRQLTLDHSLVEDYQRRGLLSAEQARNHPLRHVLSRALGPDQDVRPDCSTVSLLTGDRVLLCTDGLTKMLKDRDITECLTLSVSPDQTCERLIRSANDQGGEDNTTVVVVEVTA